MAKFEDKTMDEWDDVVDEWHEGKGEGLSLREYMRLDETDFLRYAQNITDSNLSDKEVKEEASRRGREALEGITLMKLLI